MVIHKLHMLQKIGDEKHWTPTSELPVYETCKMIWYFHLLHNFTHYLYNNITNKINYRLPTTEHYKPNPLHDYWPFLTAVVLIDTTSDPDPASLIASAPICSPEQSWNQIDHHKDPTSNLYWIEKVHILTI